MHDSLSLFQTRAQKTVEHLNLDLRTLRTGRASSQLLDPVKVEAYGSQLKLVEVASVTAPDSNLIVVTPWDKSLLSVIEKAIASAGLNFNPVVDGALIRISVPPLTQERREEMVKLLHQKVEASRVTLRNIRTESKQEIEELKGQAAVSEDDIKRLLKELDELTQKWLQEIEVLEKQKEQELITV